MVNEKRAVANNVESNEPPGRIAIPQSRGEANAGLLKAARAGDLESLRFFLKSGKADVNAMNQNGLTSLHLAAKEGVIEIVAELIRFGANVNSRTLKGNAPLHVAALAGNEQIVRVLVRNGARVNVQSQMGFSPLYMAAQENHPNIVQFLLDNDADANATTEDGFTPLSVAIQQGHNTIAALLMDHDRRGGKVRLPALHLAAKKNDVKSAIQLVGDPREPENNRERDKAKILQAVNETTRTGFTPLHLASHYGSAGVAQFLIDHGANVNFLARNEITPLHVACKWGQMVLVNLLTTHGADINSRTKDGLTPLHCAARTGHDGILGLLLARGAIVRAQTRSGLTALHCAAQGNHVVCISILLKYGANIEDVTTDYLTALHVASHCGNQAAVQALLENNSTVDARALNGFTALHVACKKNRIRVIETLMKYGANVDCMTETGLTALHVASFMGFAGVVLALLESGNAKIDCVTTRGETALHLAARTEQCDVMRILLRNNADVDACAKEKQTPLHICARLGNDEGARLLLDCSASVDAKTKDAYTALHMAVKEGHKSMVELLLDRGAKHSIKTAKGFSPLHITAKYGHWEITKLLLERNANPVARGRNSLTPLHVAAHYDKPEVAKVLLEFGSGPHEFAKNGYTPLHIAAKKNHIEVAKVLINKGAQSDAESKRGFTALHLACQEGHLDMIKLLLDQGADVNQSSRNGLTPLHLIAQDDIVQAADLLLRYRANPLQETKSGLNPLHIASHYGRTKMIQYLIERGVPVNSTSRLGFTPLHIAAQQGFPHILDLLLRYRAAPDRLTKDGLSALGIAQRMGFHDAADLLGQVTTVQVRPFRPDEGFEPLNPETIHESIEDSDEDEGSDNVFSSPQGADDEKQSKKIHEDDLRDKALNDDVKDSEEHSSRREQDLFAFENVSEGRSMSSSIEAGLDTSDALRDEMTYMRQTPQEDTQDPPTPPSTSERLVFMDFIQKQDTVIERSKGDEGSADNNVKTDQVTTRGHSSRKETSQVQYTGKRVSTYIPTPSESEEEQVEEKEVKEEKEVVTSRKSLKAENTRGRENLPDRNVSDKHVVESSATAPKTPSLGRRSKDSASKGSGGDDTISSLATAISKKIASPKGEPISTDWNEEPNEQPQVSVKRHSKTKTIPVEVVENIDKEEGEERNESKDSKSKVTKPPKESKPVNEKQISAKSDIKPQFEEISSDTVDEIKVTRQHLKSDIYSDQNQTLPRRKDKSATNVEVTEEEIKTSKKQKSTSDVCPAQPALNRKEREELIHESQVAEDKDRKYADRNKAVADRDRKETDRKSKDGERDQRTTETYYAKDIGRDKKDVERKDMDKQKKSNEQHRQKLETFEQTRLIKAPLSSSYLVSFVVDSRGGVLHSSRNTGIRITVPAERTRIPTRLTCRLIHPDRLRYPPSLFEGESLASRIIQMSPVGAVFNGQILIEFYHYMSNFTNRELVIMKSNDGRTWSEHSLHPTRAEIIKAVGSSTLKYLQKRKDYQYDCGVAKILTDILPTYFALVSRIRRDTKVIDATGGTVTSAFNSLVSISFPPRAVTKSMKVKLQVRDLSGYVMNSSTDEVKIISPVMVSLYPVHRMFRKRISLRMPLFSLNQNAQQIKNLKILSSFSEDGKNIICWKDCTESCSMEINQGILTFTSLHSARFIVLQCKSSKEAVNLAKDLYCQSLLVPFVCKLFLEAKRLTSSLFRMRAVLVADSSNVGEGQNGFVEVSNCSSLTVFNDTQVQLNVVGNLKLLSFKSKEESGKTSLRFRAFQENEIYFDVCVNNLKQSRRGQIILTTLPSSDRVQSKEMNSKYVVDFNLNSLKKVNLTSEETNTKPIQWNSVFSQGEKDHLAVNLVSTIATAIEDDWKKLSSELGFTKRDIEVIEGFGSSYSQMAYMILKSWLRDNNESLDQMIDKLDGPLNRIGRNDILQSFEEINQTIESVEDEDFISEEEERNKTTEITKDSGKISGIFNKDEYDTDGDKQRVSCSSEVTENELPVVSPEAVSRDFLDINDAASDTYTGSIEDLENDGIFRSPADTLTRRGGHRIRSNRHGRIADVYWDDVEMSEDAIRIVADITSECSTVEYQDLESLGKQEVNNDTKQRPEPELNQKVAEEKVNLAHNLKDDRPHIDSEVSNKDGEGSGGPDLMSSSLLNQNKINDDPDLQNNENVNIDKPSDTAVEDELKSEELTTQELKTQELKTQELNAQEQPDIQKDFYTEQGSAESQGDLAQSFEENKDLNKKLDIMVISNGEDKLSTESLSECSGSTVKICEDVAESEPQETVQDVQETEEILDDGTIVKKRVVRSEQRQKVTERFLTYSNEPSPDTEHAQELGHSDSDWVSGVHDNDDDEMQTELSEEILEDGTVIKRKITTTTRKEVIEESVENEEFS